MVEARRRDHSFALWGAEWLLTKLEHAEFLSGHVQLKWLADAMSQLPSLIAAWLPPLLPFIGLGLIGWDVWDRRKATSRRPGAYTVVASGTVGQAPNLGWLALLASNDDQQIEQRIYFQNQATTLRPNFGGTEPYIEIEAWFINASVYTMTLERIEGRIRYLNSDLQAAPEIFLSQSVPKDVAKKLAHGEAKSFTIRQYLMPQTKDRILADHRTNAQEAKFPLETGRIALFFSYENLNGIAKEVRKAL